MRTLVCLLLAPGSLAFQCDEARVDLATSNDAIAVAMSGDLALVGHPVGPQRARVSVLEHDGTSWNVMDTVIALPGTDGIFGSEVALDGDLGVASDILDDQLGIGTGAVYVLEPGGNGWETTRILPPLLDTGIDTNSWFGRGIAVDEASDRICVGVPRYGSFDYGAVFVYERIGGQWRAVARLQPNQPFASDGFGNALALDGDVLVVGLLGGGSVYVFERVQGLWSQAARLDNPAPNGQSSFGRSVAIHQGTVVVGEPSGGSPFITGLVHVYEQTSGTWSLSATIPAPVSDNNHFGTAVDVDGDRILATTPFAPGWQEGQVGRADLFDGSGGTWNHVAVLRASDGGEQDRMGGAAAMEGDRVLLNRPMQPMGRVHAFENPADCPGTGLGIAFCPAGTPNSVGAPGILRGLGSDRVASKLFVLQARDLPPGVPAISLTSNAQQAPMTPPGSQGTLCLGSPVRLPGVEITSHLGRARFIFDVAGHGVLAGETWNFQAWYRDQNPGSTSNLTGALEVLFQ